MRGPIFRSTDFVAGADVPEATARRILRLARNSGLVTVVAASGGRRGAVLAFLPLLDIAEGRTVF